MITTKCTTTRSVCGYITAQSILLNVNFDVPLNIWLTSGNAKKDRRHHRTEYQSNIHLTVVCFTETEISTDGTLRAEGGVSESDHSSLTSPEILDFPSENDGSQQSIQNL